MSQIEELVRATLNDRTGQAPSAGGLLTAVHRRSQRRRRNRAAALGGTLALAAGLVVAGPNLSVRIPPLHARANDAVAGNGPALVAPTYRPLVFPFTPGVWPAGLAEPVLDVRAGVASMRYPAQTRTGPALNVSVGSQPIDDPSAGRQPQRVRGHDATLGTWQAGDQIWLVLSWRESADEWVQIQAVGMSANIVASYADALLPRPVPVAVPFTFDLVPQGWLLTSVTPGSMAFGPPTDPVTADYQHQLVVDLERLDNPPAGSPVQVAGRPGRLSTSGQLWIDLGNQQALYIQQPPGLGTADLLRFAAGVHLTPVAKPGVG
jgi:hypothetical protein